MKDWEKTLSKACESRFSTENMVRLVSDIRECYKNPEKTDMMQRSKLADMWLELGMSIDYLDYSLASECYNHCIDADSRNAQGWYGLADSLCIFTKYREKALFSIDKYLEMIPSDSNGWNLRGVLLSELNRNDDALKAYDRAIELNVKNDSAYRNKIISLSELERYEEWLKTLDEISFLNNSGILSPNSIDREFFCHSRSVVLKKLERYEESLLYLDQWLKLSDYPAVEVLIDKGEVLKKLDKDKDVEICFIKAMEYALEKVIKGSYAWISSNWLDLAKCFSCFLYYKEAYQCLVIAEKVDGDDGDISEYLTVLEKYLDEQTRYSMNDFVNSLSLKEITDRLFRKAEEILSVKISYDV